MAPEVEKYLQKRKTLHGKKEKPLARTKLSVEADGSTNFLFNKLEFDDTSKAPHARLPKDPLVALRKVQGQHEKLANLRSSDPKRAVEVEERVAWSKAIDKAQGIAVRNDPKLLKRAAKRREKQKKKGKERWEERQEKIREEKMKKQEKRRENIESRKQSKKDKRRK